MSSGKRDLSSTTTLKSQSERIDRCALGKGYGRVFHRRGLREQVSEDSLLYHGSQHARVERGLSRFHMKFLDSLLSALHGIGRSNQEIRDAIRANTEAYKQQQQMPSSSGATVQLQLPEAITTYYEAERNATPRNDKWKTVERIAALSALVLSVLAALFTYRTLRQVSRQADVMEADTRPWVKVVAATLNEADALIFNPKQLPLFHGETLTMLAPRRPNPIMQVVVRATFRMTNIGKSVAQNISVFPEVFIEPPGEADAVSKEQQSFCGQIAPGRLGPQNSWSALFPTDEFSVPLTATGWVYRGDTSKINGVDSVDVVLIACVTYQKPRDYQTRVAYAIAPINSRLVKLGESLTKEEIRFIRDEHAEYAQ